MELCHRARLVCLEVLQVEAPHEEILAPDVLRDKIYLHPQKEQTEISDFGCRSCLWDCRCKISGMNELYENFIFTSKLASMGGKKEINLAINIAVIKGLAAIAIALNT